MKWLRFVNVFALLFGLALALTVSPVWAQDDMGGDAQDPPAAPQEEEPQEAPQEGDTDSDDDIDTTPSPATTAEEALGAALAAMEADDAKAIMHLLVVDKRKEGMEAEIQSFLDALKIETCAAGEVTESEETDEEGTVTVTATGTYTWECVLDVEALAEGAEERIRESLELEGEELEAAVAEKLANESENMLEFKAHLEKESHTMSFVKIDDRWYVTQPWEMPEDDADDNGEAGESEGEADEGDGDSDAATYACPMASHADQTSTDADARCPKCGMAMRLVETDDGDDD